MSSDKQADIEEKLQSLDLSLDRDFLRDLLCGLASTLQDVVGLEEASGFFGSVGQDIGDGLNAQYREGLGTPKLNLPQVAQVLVDLKRRIKGEFSVVELDEEKIVLVNRTCPFGDRVIGRRSMCMMTSNVFGTIAAENLGYARVTIEKSIAEGDRGCRVVIRLRPEEGAHDPNTREYFGA